MGEGGHRHAPSALLPERPGTHSLGGWLGPRAGLEGCGKSPHHQDSILGPSNKFMKFFQYFENEYKYKYNQNGLTQLFSGMRVTENRPSYADVQISGSGPSSEAH